MSEPSPKRRPLFWRLFPTHLALIVATLAAASLYASHTLRDVFESRLASDLEMRARLAAHVLSRAVERGEYEEADRLCRELGAVSDTRFTVVLPDGRVVADSLERPEQMGNHATRPEIAEALAGKPGRANRLSTTLREPLMYVSHPLLRDGGVFGVVRAAVSTAQIDAVVGRVNTRIALAGVFVAALGAVVSFWASRRLARPLRELREGAERFARGDFRNLLPSAAAQEIASLVDAMNGMARQLSERIAREVRQRDEQEAVLSSMVEGVLAVDTEERVISMNQAAGRLLNVDPEDAYGRDLQEFVRNTALLKFVAEALEAGSPAEAEIELAHPQPQFLQAHGAGLHDGQGRRIGAVVVLNDVTRLRRLEQVRRDFVANVSHELRTPITSIKGFVETLLDGALEDPEQAKQFLQIVARQADRLNAIIEDLLVLSRLDQKAEGATIALQPGSVATVVKAAIELCRAAAEARALSIELDIEEEVTAPMNAPLLEQAVVNLLDNAIKFSPESGRVRLSLTCTADDARISVQDWGSGIAEEHLPRLFERFYRVDRARSRVLGGTGLGLAIVKHIANVHGGRVSVQSRLGEGSTFSLYLPTRSVCGERPPRDAAEAG